MMYEELFEKLQRLKAVPAQPLKENEAGEYLGKLEEFITGYDFMRLGQALCGKRKESAMMALARMGRTAKDLGLSDFERWFFNMRRAASVGDFHTALDMLALVTRKRIQIREILKER